MKKKEFSEIAKALNRIDIIPLLYGSLGLEQRLGTKLDADDIDILIPKIYLYNKWNVIEELMTELGYTLYAPHEHAFEKCGISAAFASFESLSPFAGGGSVSYTGYRRKRYTLLFT